jgi:PAS domain S-box-containing protein
LCAQKNEVRSFFDLRSLSVQIITAFITIVILASVTVGIPAILLLQNQLDRQARAQLEQGRTVTIALFDSHYREVLNLAILTAQRPTLQELLSQNDQLALTDYLITLQSGAGLDWILVCDSNDQLIASTDTAVPAFFCKTGKSRIYQQSGVTPQVCLTAHHSIDRQGETLGDVIVCRGMDDEFETQLRDQTGLEHILWVGDEPVSTSFAGGVASFVLVSSVNGEMNADGSPRNFEINSVPYYGAQIPLDQAGLKAEVSLDVTNIVAARTRLGLVLLASIVGISFLGSILGVLLARRISRPLVRLSESATSFSLGDLNSPVNTDTRVSEIKQVAETLESARVDLLATLTSLESERDWSDHLLASVVEGILTLDSANRITFFSQGAERVTGWTSKHVMGRLVDEVFKLVDVEKSFSSILPEITGGRQKVDVLLAGDRTASLAITCARLSRSIESKTELVLVFRDVSEEEAVHRLLGQFLANIAHEFRTPLSALEASIELLLDQAPELNLKELQELHSSLHLGILGLHTLVDNLLESANIEARRFNISPRATDLGNIITEAVQTMRPLLSKYEQHLVVDLPLEIPMVRADPRRSVQVLVNLLSNASRYGPPGEDIILKIVVRDHTVRLAVIDRGPGIPSEQRTNLFRRFVFPHAKDAVSQAGAGLGLSVVKAIVDAHGGQVGVEDNPVGGSIFWFTLPLFEESS